MLARICVLQKMFDTYKGKCGNSLKNLSDLTKLRIVKNSIVHEWYWNVRSRNTYAVIPEKNLLFWFVYCAGNYIKQYNIHAVEKG